jgi:hypothetical protein
MSQFPDWVMGVNHSRKCFRDVFFLELETEVFYLSQKDMVGKQ